MKRTGLFYSKDAINTAEIAQKVKEAFDDTKIELVHIEDAWQKDFESFDFIIAGVSTWFDGELPSTWDEIIPELETLDLTGKKVAIFGLGDQVNYPDNFVDGIGILAKVFEATGAKLVGFTSIEGYQFNRSLAANGAHFTGLAIDNVNQSEKTDERIDKWIKDLKKYTL